jgi:hypothetical protein
VRSSMFAWLYLILSIGGWQGLGQSWKYDSPALEDGLLYSNGTCAETKMSLARSCSEESDGAWRLSRCVSTPEPYLTLLMLLERVICTGPQCLTRVCLSSRVPVM